MSLDKAIEHGKEHRKQYRGAQRAVNGCRNGGSCDYCRGNRMYAINKAKAKADYQEEMDDDL